MVGNHKFQFLIKGIKYSYDNNSYNWYKKVYSVEDLTNKSLEKLSGLSTLGELVAIRQFTGLVDRSGVDIYEGDIVEYWTISVDWSDAVSMYGVEPQLNWEISDIYADRKTGVVRFDKAGFFVDDVQIGIISDKFSTELLDLYYTNSYYGKTLEFDIKDFIAGAKDHGLKSPIRENCKALVIGNIHQNAEILNT